MNSHWEVYTIRPGLTGLGRLISQSLSLYQFLACLGKACNVGVLRHLIRRTAFVNELLDCLAESDASNHRTPKKQGGNDQNNAENWCCYHQYAHGSQPVPSSRFCSLASTGFWIVAKCVNATIDHSGDFLASKHYALPIVNRTTLGL